MASIRSPGDQFDCIEGLTQWSCVVKKVGYSCTFQDNQSVDPPSPPKPPGKIVTARSLGANITASSGFDWWNNASYGELG